MAVDKFLMIRKLLEAKGIKADVMIMSAECGSCPIYMEKAHNNGRYADVVTETSSIFNEDQLSRLRAIGPRIYELRLQLVQCTPDRRHHAMSWLVELEELCAQRSLIFREALNIVQRPRDPYLTDPEQTNVNPPINW